VSISLRFSSQHPFSNVCDSAGFSSPVAPNGRLSLQQISTCAVGHFTFSSSCRRTRSAAEPSGSKTRCSSVLVGTELPALIYVAEHQGSAAADEFQKILDHSGVVVNEPLGALAHSPRLPAIGRHRQSDKCISRFLRPLERRRPRYSHHYRCRIRIREVEIIWTSSSRPSYVRAANV
jgi:hypothetical protein